MRQAKLSVVVCTYNRSGLLRASLGALADQTLDPLSYEVLVVDNNSTDETRIVCDHFVGLHANFRYIFEPTQGLSHARNRGWREAAGDFIAYIDDDAKACPDWCERILRAFSEVLPHPDAVGGDVYPWFETNPPAWYPDSFERISFGETKGFLIPDTKRPGFCGSNMAFRSVLFHEHGGFDASLGMVGNKLGWGEETEFFRSLMGHGAILWYDPEILVYHYVPAQKITLRSIARRNYQKGRFLRRIDESKSVTKKITGIFFFLFFKAPKSLISSKTSVNQCWYDLLREFCVRLGRI